MKKLITAGLFTALALATPSVASADNTSWGSVGDQNLGATVGPNGGTVSVGGITTSVDGINTLNGEFSISGYGYKSTVIQKYGALGIGDVRGLHTVWTVDGPEGQISRVHGHIYYPTPADPTLAFFEADLPGQSVAIRCDLTGCDQEDHH